VAEKLGAKFIRIFTGNQENREYSWDQVAKWMVRDIRECVEYGKSLSSGHASVCSFPGISTGYFKPS